MAEFKARFDGRVIAPEHEVDLPIDRPFLVHVDSEEIVPAKERGPLSSLQWLADNAADDAPPRIISLTLHSGLRSFEGAINIAQMQFLGKIIFCRARIITTEAVC